MKKASPAPSDSELKRAAVAVLQLLRAIAMDDEDLDDAYGDLILTVEDRLARAIEASS